MEHSRGNRRWHPCHRKSCSLHSQTSRDFATSLAKALPRPPSSLPRLLLQHWFSLITPGFHRVLLRPKVGSSAEAQPWTPCTGRAEVLMGACRGLASPVALIRVPLLSHCAQPCRHPCRQWDAPGIPLLGILGWSLEGKLEPDTCLANFCPSIKIRISPLHREPSWHFIPPPVGLTHVLFPPAPWFPSHHLWTYSTASLLGFFKIIFCFFFYCVMFVNTQHIVCFVCPFPLEF